MTSRRFLLTGLMLAALAPGCGEVDEPGDSAVAHFVVPRAGVTAEFFTLPWPNDIRRDPDGTINLAGFPSNTALVSSYVSLFDEKVTGWGTNAGIFFRFSAALDPSTLPRNAEESLEPGASVYLVNIDPDSPDYHTRIPVKVTYQADPGEFIGPNSVVVLPVAGFPMRESTVYAAVLGRSVRDTRGRPFRKDIDFVTVLSDTPTEDATLEAARTAYAPLRDYLKAQSLSPAEVLNAAVFTTQEIVSTMVKLRDAVYRDMPEPPAAPQDLHYVQSGAGYHVYEGTFEGPIYQHGEAPYAVQGGGFEFDAAGEPILARTEPIRFALSVPTGELPAGGWPIALYSHGTGGSYRSHINNDTARDLARIYADGEILARVAVIGIDQVLHGTRCNVPSCNPELNFFNFQNALAGRDNVRQGALDNVQLLRLVEAMDLAAAPGTGEPIRFDSDRIFFMGHSQGGLTGPPFLAVEPKVGLAILSGAGGHMILSLLGKTEPVDIPSLITLMLGEEDQVTETHPVLSLIQLFIEPADPLNYARHFILEPVGGASPKHIFLSQGWVDHYTPPVLTEALAVAAGLDLVGPWLEPSPRLVLAGQTEALERPASGNLAGGTITGVMLQYLAWGSADGHYVVFDNPNANQDYRQFIGTALRDGLPGIPE
ncbi:MAG: hypothetical protein ABI333_01445 [bacterium]